MSEPLSTPSPQSASWQLAQQTSHSSHPSHAPAPSPRETPRGAGAHEGSLHLPRTFGRYVLFDFIGKGGMAEIFLARATTELGAARLCVVKLIIPEYAKHPQFAEMLIHEAKLAARLNHAHVVQVFDLGRSDDQPYIAMEYVEGFDLNALLRRCSAGKVPLPLEFALMIVCDVLRGLDYAHRRVDDAGLPLGIVHRDVSPSNVLISLDGEVKLCDFGIAHANDLVPRAGEPLDEALKGKAGYMSPEHARGEPIDARADVFAAGIVLWELLSGRRMYRKEDGVSLLDVARRAIVPELQPRGLPHEERLYGIVKRALAVPRDDRFLAASAFLRDLESYMAEAKLVPSPLKLGTWLDQFGAHSVAQRRLRDRQDSHSHAPSEQHASSVLPPPPPSTPLRAIPDFVKRDSAPPDSARRASSPPDSSRPDSPNGDAVRPSRRPPPRPTPHAARGSAPIAMKSEPGAKPASGGMPLTTGRAAGELDGTPAPIAASHARDSDVPSDASLVEAPVSSAPPNTRVLGALTPTPPPSSGSGAWNGWSAPLVLPAALGAVDGAPSSLAGADLPIFAAFREPPRARAKSIALVILLALVLAIALTLLRAL